MPVMVQIRNMPDDLHRKLKSRAAQAGMSLSDYLISEASRWSDGPTVEELRARMAARKPVHLSESPTKALRAEREGR